MFHIIDSIVTVSPHMTFHS